MDYIHVPANEQNNNSRTEIDIKKENVLKNYISDTISLSETKPDVNPRATGKVYISEHYWQEKKPVFAKKLPYDIDNKCTYVLPINKSNFFKSVKEGRP